MARYVSISKNEHRDAGYIKVPDMQYARSDMTVPLLIEEVPYVLTTMPIVFVQQSTADPASKDGDIVQYEMCALMSLEPGNNLFISQDGRWLTGYVPAAYRAYPFKALPKPGSQALALCFNLDSGLFLENPGTSGERFFDNEGAPVELLKNTLTFLEKCEKNRKITENAVAALVRHKLIVPLPIKIQLDEAEPRLLEGIYSIDEQAMRKLSAEALLDLNKNNGLAIAYAQLYSQHRLQGFNKLYQIRQEQSGDETPADISGILSADSSSLKFN